MIVAGVIIETAPGASSRVAVLLYGRPGLELQGGDGHQRLAGVWTAESGEALEKAAEALLEEIPDVVGVYPTLVGDDSGDGPVWEQPFGA